MATLKVLLLTGVFAATIFFVVSTMGSEPCTDVASVFLNKLQGGDLESLLPLFGENSCHCQPRGGFLAYLKYESGENDNIAYLFGHKFKPGKMSVKEVPTIEKGRTVYHLPWEAPESSEVDLPVTFERAVYSPFFLPLDTAFGYAIKEQDLKAFAGDPSLDFLKATSLRLRPRLDKGVVPPLPAPDAHRQPEFMSDLFRQLLGPQETKYLRPADAGEITGADGKNKAAADFASEFPRLKAGKLRIYMGRRGKFQHWLVKKLRLKDPVFELPGGKEIALKTPEAALVDIHGPALTRLP